MRAGSSHTPDRMPWRYRRRMEIWHLAYREHWDTALRDGSYAWSTRGATLADVGFIHASGPDQLRAVAESFYRDETAELCVLVMDSDTIVAAGTPVRWEDGGAGEEYPHIYGAIHPEWVRDVRPVHMSQHGTLVMAARPGR